MVALFGYSEEHDFVEQSMPEGLGPLKNSSPAVKLNSKRFDFDMYSYCIRALFYMLMVMESGKHLQLSQHWTLSMLHNF